MKIASIAGSMPDQSGGSFLQSPAFLHLLLKITKANSFVSYGVAHIRMLRWRDSAPPNTRAHLPLVWLFIQVFSQNYPTHFNSG